jgi:hypothetical protein
MSEVKRWTCEAGGCFCEKHFEMTSGQQGSDGPVVYAEGEWVRYTDHATEVDAYKTTIAQLEALVLTLEGNAKDGADMIGRMGSDLVAARRRISELEAEQV